MKRLLILVCFSVLILPFVSARLDGVENQIQGAAGNLENNITKIREFTEKDRWDFIGSQWKELLLKNKVISGINALFIKINIIFKVLFNHDWALSLEFLFVFLLWLFTLLSICTYVKVWRLPFLDKLREQAWSRFFVSLGMAIILAHTRVFNYLTMLGVKLVLYKASFWWRFATIALIFMAIFVYLQLNRIFGKSLEKARDKRAKAELDERVKNIEGFQKEMVKAKESVEKF